MLIVLSPNLSSELNSIVTGVVYLSFTNFISDAYLIIWSLISLLYIFVVGMVAIDLVDLSSESPLDKNMVASLFSGVFSEFIVFDCNFWSDATEILPIVALNDLVAEQDC